MHGKILQTSNDPLHDTQTAGLKVTCISTIQDLRSIAPEILNLANNGISNNPFYEEWMLIPAFEFLQQNEATIALVWAENGKVLVGLFPLEVKSSYHGCRFKYYSLWRHIHCFLGTPLIRITYEQECLSAFFAWLGAQPFGGLIFQFENIASDDHFFDHLHRFIQENGLKAEVIEKHLRPILHSELNADAYLRASMSAKHLKALNKKRGKLDELGSVEVSVLSQSDQLSSGIESFLRLEQSGWKGENNTAMSCHESESRFFRAIMEGAFKRDRLQLFMMTLNKRPIAMRCGFMSGKVAYSFKIAFDEAFGMYSPGVLLELEYLKIIQDQDEIEWVDSCATSGSSALSRLWRENREISTIAVGMDTIMGRSLVSAVSGLKSLRASANAALPRSA